MLKHWSAWYAFKKKKKICVLPGNLSAMSWHINVETHKLESVCLTSVPLCVSTAGLLSMLRVKCLVFYCFVFFFELHRSVSCNLQTQKTNTCRLSSLHKSVLSHTKNLLQILYFCPSHWDSSQAWHVHFISLFCLCLSQFRTKKSVVSLELKITVEGPKSMNKKFM